MEKNSNLEKEPQVKLEHKFAHIFSIINNGEKIGEVEVPTDLDGDTYAISDVHLLSEYRGHGFGVATYKALIEMLDKPIETFGANPEAIYVWESLVRQGFAKRTENGFISIK